MQPAPRSPATAADYPTVTTTTKLSGPCCVARYDYESDYRDDLSFLAGDVIALKGWVGDDWLRGELNDKQGIFPMTFVEIIEPPTKLESDAVEKESIGGSEICF